VTPVFPCLQIREIISHLNRQRQNLFFSATWPREVQQLANEFLTDAVQINIGDSGVLNANKVDYKPTELLFSFHCLTCLLSLLKPDTDCCDQLFSIQAITQHIICLTTYEKERTLVGLLNKLNKSPDKNPDKVPKTIIFVGRKADCDILSNTLYR
jgi:superfamily II DNA/RNA helicase